MPTQKNSSYLHIFTQYEYKIVFSIFSDSENLYFRGMADTNEVSKLRRARKEKGCCNSSGWEKEITALFSKLKLLHSAKKMEGLFFQSISGLPDSKKRSQALRLLKSPFEYRAKIKEGSENKITCNKGISSFFPGFFASLQENPS